MFKTFWTVSFFVLMIAIIMGLKLWQPPQQVLYCPDSISRGKLDKYE